MPTLDLVLRSVVFVAFGASALVAATHWLVRTGRLTPFGGWPRLVRRVSDPVVQPIERRLLRAGGNPQQAPLWLAGGVLLLGLILLQLVPWLLGFVARFVFAASAGPRTLLLVSLDTAFGIMNLALIVRVIASWFGVHEYARWMRPFVFLTEWLLAPIRRAMPRTGMFDLSPLVAYVALMVLRWAVFSLLRG